MVGCNLDESRLVDGGDWKRTDPLIDSRSKNYITILSHNLLHGIRYPSQTPPISHIGIKLKKQMRRVLLGHV